MKVYTSEIPVFFNFAKQFVRCQSYANQFHLLNLISSVFGQKLKNDTVSFSLRSKIIKEVFYEMYQDSKRVAAGEYYPDDHGDVFTSNHLKSYFNILKDYGSVLSRRKNKKYKLKNEKDYPDYFNRAFHFQTDGYTSEHSAKMYDHQVEILFSGIASIMRKMLITSLNKNYGKIQGDFLELATGTGIGAKLVKDHFPAINMTATDISREYIQYASKKFSKEKINFQVEDATNLENFEDNQFDVVYQIFLLHEVPQLERERILKEQIRVLKQGGIGIIIESIQEIDRPEWKPILDDFPKRYHEPYYNNYVQTPIEPFLEQHGAKIVDLNQILFSKCVTFTK
jgi:ubiquinone/menaquinone biosynthesis C-methylase UbiE